MTTCFVLIVMVAVLQFRTAISCPNFCRCQELPRNVPEKSDLFYMKVTCNNLINATINLPENTREIVLVGVKQNELSTFIKNLTDNLGRLPYLSSLILKQCDTRNITFNGLQRLNALDISYNKIEQLNNSKVLLNLTSLRALELSNNQIKVLDYSAFRTLDNLQVLNLSANALETLTSDSFIGLNTLKCLDLSANNLTRLSDEILVPLKRLLYLNLSNNHLQVLDETCFSSLLYLQQLDLSWNRLARVAPGSLHLPSLARLLLAGNSMLGGSREPPLLMGTGRRLQTVDASRTGLKQVPAALTHSIRTLRLAGNSIRVVSRGDLDSYPLLQLLDFTSNVLEEIEDDALGRLDSLAVLYLTDNKINTIPKSLSERLQVLHLENNEIKQLSNGDFQGLEQLEVLLLCDNKIQVVEESAFSELESLATLDLSRNPINKLGAGCLYGPTQLQVLRLCGLSGINSPAKDVTFPLSAPEHLITLDLSNSPGLARQLLADDAALVAARELQELNLSGNGLEYIRSDLIHFLSQLRLLDINNNPLNCTDMQWLALWMRRQDEPQHRSVSCVNPPELWGTLLIDLQNIEYHEINSINQTKQFSTDTKKTAPFPDTERNKLNNILTYNINFTKTEFRLQSTRTVGARLPDEVSTVPLQPLSSRNASATPRYDEVPSAPTTSISLTTSPPPTTLDVMQKLNASNINNSLKSLNLNTSANNETTQSNDVTIGITQNLINASKAKSTNKKVTTWNVENYNNKLNEPVPKDTRTNEVRLPAANRGTNKYVAGDTITSTLITSSSSRSDENTENVPASATGEMSMYSLNERNDGYRLLHPGMLILAVGILGTAASLAMLTSKFTRRRKRRMMQEEDIIEVSSLPSVTELW